MPIQSTNPATGEVVQTFDELTDAQVEEKVQLAADAFRTWRRTSFAERAKLMHSLASILRERADKYGQLISLEMGKPITQAKAEVEKAAFICEYYAEHAAAHLASEHIEAGKTESFIRFDPIGPVLAVMPWNFPFVQVLRFAAPAAMAGNVGLLKHASNVPQCALAIEQAFADAGFPAGVFQTLLVGSAKVEGIVRDKRVAAVTLTGSEPAGKSVASIAGDEIKKSVMELGGADPFIIRADADLDRVLPNAVTGRLQNCGQSCICAKRFIVHSSLYDTFIERMKIAFEEFKVGDQLDPATQMGPMVDLKARGVIVQQVQDTVAAGGRLVTGGAAVDGPGAFMQPTIIADVQPGMPLWLEETFGPVATIIPFETDEEAIEIANSTDFGLAGSIHTQDVEKAKDMAAQIESGGVFINTFSASDPRLPFGGVKRSGYGRELSREGIREFVNAKTVVVA